jgi:hypothetical protein
MIIHIIPSYHIVIIVFLITEEIWKQYNIHILFICVNFSAVKFTGHPEENKSTFLFLMMRKKMRLQNTVISLVSSQYTVYINPHFLISISSFTDAGFAEEHEVLKNFQTLINSAV